MRAASQPPYGNLSRASVRPSNAGIAVEPTRRKSYQAGATLHHAFSGDRDEPDTERFQGCLDERGANQFTPGHEGALASPVAPTKSRPPA